MRTADPISAFAGLHKGGDSSGPSRLFVPFFFFWPRWVFEPTRPHSSVEFQLCTALQEHVNADQHFDSKSDHERLVGGGVVVVWGGTHFYFFFFFSVERLPLCTGRTRALGSLKPAMRLIEIPAVED